MQEKNCYNSSTSTSIPNLEPYSLVSNNGITYIEFRLQPFKIPQMAHYLCAIREDYLKRGYAEFESVQIFQDNCTVKVCLASSSGVHHDSQFLLKIMDLLEFKNTSPFIPALRPEPIIPVNNKRRRGEENAKPISVKQPRRSYQKINWNETTCMQGESPGDFIIANPLFNGINHNNIQKHFKNLFRMLNLSFDCNTQADNCVCISVDETDLAALKKENPDLDLRALLQAECNRTSNRKRHDYGTFDYYHYKNIVIIKFPSTEFSQIQMSLLTRLSRTKNLQGYIGTTECKTGPLFMLYLKKDLPEGKNLLNIVHELGFNPTREIKNQEPYVLNFIIETLRSKTKLTLPYYIYYSPVSDNEIEIISDLLDDNTLKQQLDRLYKRLLMATCTPFTYSINDGKLHGTYNHNDTWVSKLLSSLKLVQRAPAQKPEINQNSSGIETDQTEKWNNAYEEMEEKSPSLNELFTATTALENLGFFKPQATSEENKNSNDNRKSPGI